MILLIGPFPQEIVFNHSDQRVTTMVPLFNTKSKFVPHFLLLKSENICHIWDMHVIGQFDEFFLALVLFQELETRLGSQSSLACNLNFTVAWSMMEKTSARNSWWIVKDFSLKFRYAMGFLDSYKWIKMWSVWVMFFWFQYHRISKEIHKLLFKNN